MPERPDLEYVVPLLRARLVGCSLGPPRVRKPVVLRALATDLVGVVRSAERRAHTVVFELDGPPGTHDAGPRTASGGGRLPAGVPDPADPAPTVRRELVISPMLAGRFQVVPVGTKDPADLALAWPIVEGRAPGAGPTGPEPAPVAQELRYRDDVQMGKVYLVDPGTQPVGVAWGGVDVLGPEFTIARLAALCARRRDQVKVVLMDKAELDAMGNAYADEVLWHAGVHPKALAYKLAPGQVAALHDAVVTVLGHARDVIAGRKPPMEEKLRDFLHVRGRVGPCDRCGTTLRTTGVHGHDAYFCPTCQAAEGAGVRKGVVDWGRVR